MKLEMKFFFILTGGTMKFLIIVIFTIVILNNGSLAKLDPDVNRVSELVNKKQEELKDKLISNLVLNYKSESNLLSFNTFDNIVRTLVNEKNKEVMKGEIIAELSRFAITSTVAKIFIADAYSKILGQNDQINDSELMKILATSTRYETAIDESNLIDLDNDSTQIVNYIIDQISIRIFKVAELKSLYSENAFKNFDVTNVHSYSKIEEYKFKIDSLLNIFFTKKYFMPSLKLITYFNDLKLKEIPLLLSNSKFMDYLIESLEYNFNDRYKNNINFTFLSNISNLINKYIIIEMDSDEKPRYDIDVEAIILELVSDYIDYSIVSIKNCYFGLELFFDIGVNNSLYHRGSLTNTFDDRTISYVSEKIGLKVIFNDFEYTRKQNINEWYKYRGKYYKWNEKPKQFIISDVHFLIYYSGLLYNIVDLKSEKNFNYSLIGSGFGIKFFNSLTFSISYAIPVSEKINDSFGNGFINLGMDIPILEYLAN